MSSTRGSLRTKLPELMLGAVMVVFAVLVALGFEEWRDEQQMQEFADRARAAVVAEIRANLDESRATGPALRKNAEEFGTVLREDDLSLLERLPSIGLPDYSSAAWGADQTSQAAPYLDYDWVIQVARVYEIFDPYPHITEGLIDRMSLLFGRPPTMEDVNSLYGLHQLLIDFHGQIEVGLEALLEEEG